MKKFFSLALGLSVLSGAFGMYLYAIQVPRETLPNPALPLLAKKAEVSLETQLGQNFMIGHWADTPVASTTALLKKYGLGGVVIMSAPQNPEEIVSWVQEWKEVSSSSLFIAIDQEGGPVTRLKNDPYVQTGQQEIHTSDEAHALGVRRGAELSRLGINMNFAPVLDRAQNPTSFMYSRTFPADTDTAELAGALIAGMKQENVIAVAKHFPGHDDTNVDSHNELPAVPIAKAELSEFTQPFSDLIAHESPLALMTAHVQFPQIDPLPATLSEFFLTTYLRDELGFTGIIVTDDMSMDAIDSHYTVTNASIRALAAGANLILLAAEPDSIESIFPIVLSAAQSSTSLQSRVAENYSRNMSLKQNMVRDTY